MSNNSTDTIMMILSCSRCTWLLLLRLLLLLLLVMTTTTMNTTMIIIIKHFPKFQSLVHLCGTNSLSVWCKSDAVDGGIRSRTAKGSKMLEFVSAAQLNNTSPLTVRGGDLPGSRGRDDASDRGISCIRRGNEVIFVASVSVE